MLGLNYVLNELPPWLAEPYKEMLEKTRTLSTMPYPQYRGEVISPFSPETLKAFEMMQTGAYKPDFESARHTFGQAGRTFPESFQSYMNPYTSEVINVLARQGGQTLREQILPQLQAQFVGLGQDRSTAHDELRARHARDLEQSILNAQSQALERGYGQAADIHSRERAAALELGKRQAELGRAAQAGQALDVEQLMQQGQLKQAQAQNILNEQRQEFLRQAYWPFQVQQQTANLMKQVPSSGITSETLYRPEARVPQVNLAGQVGSMASQLYGMGQTGMFGQHKTGGSIKSSRLKKAAFGLSGVKFKMNKNSQKHLKMKYGKFNKGL